MKSFRASESIASATRIGADETANDRTLILLSAGLTLTAVTALFAIREGTDDAYIVFRYVLRWLNGQGLTFNEGEAVEGFTSFSWVMVLAFFTRLTGMPVAAVSIVVNYVLLLATAVLLERVLRTAGASVTARAVALAVFGTSFPYFQVTFLGLELALFGLLLTLFGALLSSAVGMPRFGRQGAITLLALGLVGGLLAATRPETVVLLPLVLVGLHVRGPRPSGRALCSGVLAYAGVTGAVFLWRQLHYGEWLPNSVIAKSIAFDDPRLLSVIEQRVRDGLTYLGEAYTTYPIFAAVTGLALVVAITGALSRRSMALLLPLILAHAMAVENGGDWMPQFRLMTMYWPVWMLAAWSMSSDLHGRYGRVAVPALVVVLALHGWSTARAVLATDDVPLQVTFEDGWPELRITDDASVNGFSFAYDALGQALRRV